MLIARINNPKIEMTRLQRLFLLSHYGLMTYSQMACTLNVSDSKVRCWLLELGIRKVYKKSEGRSGPAEFFAHDKNLFTI